MKKIIFILCVLFISISSTYYISAESMDLFRETFQEDPYLEIVSPLPENHSAKIYYINISHGSLRFAGAKVSDYYLRGAFYIGDNYCTGKFIWENPNYILQEGEQILRLYFESVVIEGQEDWHYPFKEKEIFFDVKIYGYNKDAYYRYLRGETKIEEQKQKILLNDNISSEIYNVLIGTNITNELPPIKAIDESGNVIIGKTRYHNLDNTRLGIWNLNWTFTPDDNSYKELTGFYTLNVLKNDDYRYVKSVNSIRLNKDSLTLMPVDVFDINIKNKIKGSKYEWSSNNTKIAKVNKKNGIVTAIKKGKATIICKITLPDGNIKTVKCDVTVK